MFNTYIHNAIDQIQNSKKEFVKHAVKHDQPSSIFNTFIDAQTIYTKNAADAGVDAITSVGMLFLTQNSYKWFK